jgi:hypothetical protein
VYVILTHIDAVWQFRQIQTPEDGHIGPKHVVLSESERKIIICCIADGIIDCLIRQLPSQGTRQPE